MRTFCKRIGCVFVCSLFVATMHAQWTWNDPAKADFHVIQNRAWAEELGNSYVRLPERAQAVVRPAVWGLSRNAAGLAIHFYSDAPEIMVRYAVEARHSMPHMPATGVSGVDLYSSDGDGEWNFNFGNYHFGDTITYHYQNIPSSRHPVRGYEYRLFLPLYNTVKWMEIGVPASASFQFIPLRREKPVVVYGTSIAQGACASRPAMGWSNILQRTLDYPVVNLGFSGNGRMEEVMIDLLAEIDAKIYILDCLPNLVGMEDEEVYQLLVEGIKRLREKRTTPILMVEHVGYSNAATNMERKRQQERLNRISHKAYLDLTARGIDNLHYLFREELGVSADGWVDYIHLTDIGMQQQAVAIKKKIQILFSVPQEVMQKVYEEVKTPYKYGIVVMPPDTSKMVDSPSIFRHKNKWYMTYIVFDGKGYETWIAESTDLLSWKTQGRIMSFTKNTWDANQKAGYIALQDYTWGGSYEVEPYDGKYWMSYLGGATEGYEAGILGVGMGYTTKLTAPKEWKRIEHPVLLPGDDDARWYDNQTIYKSTVIHDKEETLGYPFVMYYNAKSKRNEEKKIGTSERIAMAVSDDMVNWKRYGQKPVIDHQSEVMWDKSIISGDAFITKMDNLWVMFYFGAFWKTGAFDRFACSYDLVNWTVWNGDDLIAPSEPFDDIYAHKPFVIQHEGVVYHFYCAVNQAGQRSIAVATSRKIDKK